MKDHNDDSCDDSLDDEGGKFAVIVVTEDFKSRSQRTFLVVLDADGEKSADDAAMNTIRTLFKVGVWNTMFLPYPDDLNYGVVEIDFPVNKLGLVKVAKSGQVVSVGDDPLDLRLHM
jgi:hypothetical protein